MYQALSKVLVSFGGLCSIIFPAYATQSLPKQARVPGGVAIIDLEIKSNDPPVVHYLGNRALVLRNKKHNQWQAIIGIPLGVTLGINQIEIQTVDGIKTKNFIVKDKKYPTEHLTIKETRKVEPLAEDLAKIEAEYLETIQTYAGWEYQTINSIKLPMPVRGRKSSGFGLQRIMNNVPKNPHSGLDIAAPQGTKVTCPKDGVVVNIGNYFYSGNIVFVDHGQGFITSYAHLNTITVNKGQKVTKGTVLGTVGKTGRASGPHLHWSVSLNGVRVDPQLFIDG